MSPDWASARALILACTSATWTVTVPTACTPTRSAWDRSVMASEVAMRVLLGTQSASTHMPPTPSRSTRVTSAPSCTATRAAS